MRTANLLGFSRVTLVEPTLHLNEGSYDPLDGPQVSPHRGQGSTAAFEHCRHRCSIGAARVPDGWGGGVHSRSRVSLSVRIGFRAFRSPVGPLGERQSAGVQCIALAGDCGRPAKPVQSFRLTSDLGIKCWVCKVARPLRFGPPPPVWAKDLAKSREVCSLPLLYLVKEALRSGLNTSQGTSHW